MGKFQDLTGKRFGEITVLQKAESIREPNGKLVTMWKCQCDCGTIFVVKGASLRSGNTKSCGCTKEDNLLGNRYGNLTVLEKSKGIRHPNGKVSTAWLCRCDCGRKVVVESQSLKSGNTKSCGCLRRKIYSEKFTKHGMSSTRIYGIWAGIVNRCTNENCDSHGIYIKRGITICEEWRKSPEKFIEWSMENGYSDGLTIDRIDNNKGYSPDNCRWVDTYIQANNKRNNKRIFYNGETKSLAEWCRELDIPYSRTQLRLARGWSVEEAFNKF